MSSEFGKMKLTFSKRKVIEEKLNDKLVKYSITHIAKLIGVSRYVLTKELDEYKKQYNILPYQAELAQNIYEQKEQEKLANKLIFNRSN